MFNRHAWPKRRPVMVTDANMTLKTFASPAAEAAAKVGTVLSTELCPPAPGEIAMPRAAEPAEFD